MQDFLKVVVYGGLFAVPFLTLYVANDYFFPFITGKNFAFRIIVEVVFAAWAVLCLLDVKYRPKFSWILSSFSALLIVMFFANLFGQHPESSFWSNFERMDGYVTLVHIFLYGVVLGSVMTTKQSWSWYLHATLLAAFITALYGVAQYSGMVEGFENRRMESFLGNAAYLSIYMLFHIFIAFWMFVESKVTLHRVVYILLAVLFTYALMYSGTRGTVLGFGVGLGAMVTYIMFFGAKYREFRKYAIGAFIFLALGAGTLILGKEADFIQKNGSLSRIANINLSEDLKVRGTIWGMAWEGVKERPVLGWGQGNFNYVFNEQYDPFLFNQEQWFDRAHSIVFDWLIAGGFLGLIAYLGIFVACGYYLFLQPLLKKDDATFTVLERGVLLGILVGYFTHNLVVFDNIVSYIFFGLILALIHSRVAQVMPAVQKFKVDQNLVNQFIAPVAAVLVIAIIYTTQVPGMLAAGDLIDGYQAQDPKVRLEAFKRAINRDSFARQEVVEQIAQQAMNIARDTRVEESVRQEYVELAIKQLDELAVYKPGDARIHVFMGTFYRAVGDLNKAAEQMQIAHELSPLKQSIISQQAIIAYSQGNIEQARDMFAEALALDDRNTEAREYYAAMLFLNNQVEEAKALVVDEATLKGFAANDFLLSAVNQVKEYPFMIELYKIKIEQNPENEQSWASLAFLYSAVGNKEAAVATLREAAIKRPTFAKKANCIANNIEADRNPEEGC
ncbi:MAG TPA: O-antigen ligase family protein [Candidatus Paceibacterota bacterium]|nr:O-antigen ligase family protein [Candidatus Paceibacterota bacterium]